MTNHPDLEIVHPDDYPDHTERCQAEMMDGGECVCKELSPLLWLANAFREEETE